MSMGKLSNAERAAVQRILADRAAIRYALVTNYDPATHMAMVNLMPEQIVTGWLPIVVHWVGNGFGIYVGLDIGNQVLVAHVEGDPNAGIVIGRLNSDSEVPPNVPAGEAIMQHTSGSLLHFTNDGKVAITSHADMNLTVGGKLNATIQSDANLSVSGKTVLTCNDVELGASGGKAVVLDGDPVSGGVVHATSTKVKAT